MSETLKIRIDFAEKRQRPADVFQAMSCYIEAYQAFGQVIVHALGDTEDFVLQLESVEAGSVASFIRAVPGRVKEWMSSAIIDSGFQLADTLSGVQSTATEGEVDAIASVLENELTKSDNPQMINPKIDRKELAYALQKFSEANKKLLPEESVETSLADTENVTPINTHWRFNANPKNMFLGLTTSFNGVDRLYVRAPVNIGKGAWSMVSVTTGSRYNANISDLKWLDDYQNGMVRPIGPKDVMEAEVSFQLYTPPPGQGKPYISNAKVVRILEIHRSR
ncbi:hypothetical protein TZ03_03020 [Pseudomonas sp. 10-1B]|jgi:hypothetical protein|uniref:hypothetical protein n=1 Tax=Pseudomonas sp. 10-1B TaxID=1546029 RepID=UPI00061E865D|nr:hypothetical protein [Pseudomonas sp. 10-1B]KIY42261.1 hypothetical protein TZ03_03020 [Pseudomonas sp. 10-1B]